MPSLWQAFIPPNKEEINMSFVIYDVTFMIVFTIAVILFLRKKKNNLEKQGFLNLYKTKVGLKLMDSISSKFSKILTPLQYFMIGLGYALMGIMLWMIMYSAYIYVRYPEISQAIKAPPIVPLVPYFPQLFGLQSFFPQFNFTYFLVAIVIVAVVHEFSHGIIARLNKIKIKTTGFAFAGPIVYSLYNSIASKKISKSLIISTLAIILAAFWLNSWLMLIFLIFPLLGAFVEQDDKQMNKASKFKQLSVLSAGVFANISFALIFLGILWIFFLAAFSPAGITFQGYAPEALSLGEIKTINNLSIQEFLIAEVNSSNLVAIKTLNNTYFAYPSPLKSSLKDNQELFLVYQDTPALKSGLKGIITAINGEKILSLSDLSQSLNKYNPGDKISITTNYNEEISSQDVTLSSNPEGKAYLGIRVSAPKSNSILASFYNLMPKVNNLFTGVYYESKIGDIGTFLFYMIWWVIVINFFVGLFNMLPLGILDGGKFFMLTIAGITRSDKIGDIAFKAATALILAALAVMMFAWVFNVF